jgi:hypothetical protein
LICFKSLKVRLPGLEISQSAPKFGALSFIADAFHV